MDFGHRSGDHSGRDPYVHGIELRFLVACAAVYAVNQLWIKPQLGLGVAQNYLNDVAAGALLSAFSIMLVRQRYRPSRVGVAIFVSIVVAAAGCFWEYITPLYRTTSVTDPLDMVAYWIGAGLYLTYESAFYYISVKSSSHKSPH